ncbi:MAG: exo-alpha-sialidase [Cellulosimicrobium funkei]
MIGHLRRPAHRAVTVAATLALAVGGVVAPVTTASAHHTTLAPDFDLAPATGGPGSYTEQQLATNGQGGFPNYRIPALTVAPNGDVLASYDGRPTAADSPGPNSILQRRSTDDGVTWGPQEVVAAGKTTAPIEGYSDPSYVVDRETGTIFNFHVKSYDQGFGGSRPGVDPTARDVIHANVSASTDDGRTWTHRTITADVTADLGWRSRFAASGQGIQLRYGPHAGRLVQQYTIINGSGQFQAVSVYSDDHGATWQVGQPVGTGMDENKTVELSDGRVMLNSRDSAGSKYRKVAYSTDGGVTYGPVTLDTELPDPTNNASIVRAYPNAPQGSAEAKVLLFSNAASQTGRVNGTVRVSYDDGETWPVARVFQPGGMAYSTLATLADGTVGLLYEPGGGGGGIRFAKLDHDWLLAAPSSTPGEVEVTAASVTSATPAGGWKVGDVVTYSFTVTNLSDAVTTVSPTGNLERFDPAQGAPNCRYRNLGARAAYTCTSARHTITQADLDAGFFAPRTTWTSTSGTTVTTVEHEGPGVYFGAPGNISVRGTHANPQPSYAVGDRLSFTFDVRNLSTAATQVVPTGNLAGLDPANAAQNCRYRNLPAEGSYTCTFAYHVVTQADLDRGSFTPATTWTSTSGSSVTVVELDGPTVELAAAPAALAVQATSRCLAGGAYVAVTARNTGDEPADVTLRTPYGERTVGGVQPGRAAYQSFAVRAASVDAGSASAGPATAAVDADCAAADGSCHRARRPGDAGASPGRDGVGAGGSTGRPAREQRGGEEADGAEERPGVVPPRAQVRARGRVDVRPDGGRREGDGADHVQPRAVPRARVGIPQMAPVARREDRERRRHEERDRAVGVGPPPHPQRGRGLHGRHEGRRRAHVEAQRPDELHGRGPPVPAVGGRRARAGRAAPAQAELDERRGREEDRADDERHPGRHGAHRARVRRERADEEAQRPRREPPRLAPQAAPRVGGAGPGHARPSAVPGRPARRRTGRVRRGCGPSGPRTLPG